MPIIKSAKKRVRVAAKQSTQNAKTKRVLRDRLKAFQAALTGKKDTTKAQAEAYSALDTAVKKGIITKNKAARKKSQLTSAAKAAGTSKPGTKKTAKPAAKKTTAPAKKAPAKKPAAKTAAKKPAAKKTTKK